MTTLVALIPARGGSKRFPRKNIAPFRGRPIIAHTIDAANGCGIFDDVVVSTEDTEIMDVGRAYGARVVERPVSLAADEAGVAAVCLDFLESERSAGRAHDVLCCLYATAPLRNASDIRRTVELIEPGICDFALAVTRYRLPPHQALRPVGDGALAPMWPELVNRRENDVGPFVVDNGSTYAVAVGAFRDCGTFYGPRLRGYTMPMERSVDIDHPEDLELAEFFAARAQS